MSTHAASTSTILPAESSSAASASRALMIGAAGLVLTAIGAVIAPDKSGVAMSYLVGFTFWVAIAIGMLMLVLIHHIFDASWSVVLRRQYEHWMTSFFWLGLLFVPLLVLAWMTPDTVWSWMDLDYPLHGHGTVGTDILYQKKSSFLNRNMFTGMTVLFYASWIWLTARLRKASFTQDSDGDVKWTFMNRKTAAFGLPIGALTLTFASIYWVKSLEYHWFSTMYGVWFFANCVRGALCIGVLMMVWLYRRGDLKGVLNTNHFLSIGQLMLDFPMFWAFVRL